MEQGGINLIRMPNFLLIQPRYSGEVVLMVESTVCSMYKGTEVDLVSRVWGIWILCVSEGQVKHAARISVELVYSGLSGEKGIKKEWMEE